MQEQDDTQQRLSKLPTCAAEYVKLVIKKMRYRRKIRHDVQAELASHFEDTLKDCATNKERDEKARQLIDEFGDAKLIAVLLRRAKKRCRPLWAKAIVRSLQALGVIVLYLLICFGRLTIGTPTISVNYIDWLNDKVRAGRDESNNALPYYEKATEACVKMPTQITNVHRRWPGDLNDVEMQARLKWINDSRQAIELLRQGSKQPYYWHLYEAKEPDLMKGDFMTNVMQSLPGYRQAAFAMESQILHKAYGGDVGSALSDCVVLQEFGSHMQGKGLLIEQLVGIAIEAIGHKTMRRILDSTEVPAGALKSTQEELENLYGNRSKIIDLEAEKAFSYDYIQRTFTDDGKGSGRLLVRGLPLAVGSWKSGLWGFLSFSYPDRREVTARIDRYFQQASEFLDKTPWQLHMEGASQQWGQVGKESFLLKISMPAYGKVSELTWRAKTQRAGLLTVLALLRYEKDKGQYPANLSEFVATGYLKQLPMDPYSDKPLVYRKTDHSFTLYSVSLNFTDDGGEVFRDDKGRVREWFGQGDHAFWPVSKARPEQ
jgi:hypothetical protein